MTDKPIVKHTPAEAPAFDPVEAMLRLAVGLTLIGSSGLMSRLREWERDVLYSARPPQAQREYTAAEQLRSALIGLAFVGGRRASAAIRDLLDLSTARHSSAYRQLDQAARAPFLRLVFSPIKRAVDGVAARGDGEVERWIRIGRIEERDSRLIAAQAIDDTFADLLDALARDPSITELVQQQSLGLASEVLDDVRQGAVSADAAVDTFVRRLLGRLPPPHPAAPDPRSA